jgi:steroid delta-isomerase-like uncharacterized protein
MTISRTASNPARHLLTRYFEEVLNGKAVDKMEEIFAADIVYHSAGSPDIVGLPAMKKWVREYLAAVPDYEARLEDTIAAGDRAVLRWSCTGTHRGTLLGFPATGRPFTLTGITIFREAGGKIVEGWIERDSLGLSKQLSAAPKA